METKDTATKITSDKITRFVERLKKIGIDVKLFLEKKNNKRIKD